MASKFFYLYFITGIIALIWFIYKLIYLTAPASWGMSIVYFLPVIVLFYLAYKVYHEKKDSELM